MQIDYTVAVVGNPNCGKTTLFNVLTGARQHVGNWPGVTVEKKTGEYTYDGKLVEVVDLPGTYSLESDSEISLDERVARDFVAAKEADLIINILDASNIERNLYLTSQLIEMRVPMIVVLNMMDVVARRGLQIDIEKLAEQLASPVIAISASTRQGIKELKDRVSLAVVEQSISHLDIEYPPEIEKAITTLSVSLQQQAIEHKCNLRWLAIRLLERDTLAKKISGSECAHQAEVLEQAIENATDDEVDILAADARYGFVNQVTHLCVNKIHEVSRGMTNKIDKWVLNRYLGIPIFLLVMYLMFMITINIGSAFIDFFDQVAGAIFVDGFSILLSALSLPEWLVVLLANGAGGGVQVVATFIPIIGFLFLVLSLLEDSGYMARAAFVVDRFMGMIGLPGKSFVPMIVGFGCNVPAIMATRTLESQRDRILTNIMNPFMSCGARLPVYALFAAAFFPVGGQNLVFGLYVFGILVAVFTGLIMRHTLFKGESMPFIMELPNYHLPTLQSIVIRTWDRLKTFLVNAGKVIVPMVLVLNFLNSLGTDGSFGKENTQKSVLSEIGRTLVPVFQPMGIREDNWPATVGIFTGILAKEAVVGTLDALYSQLALDGAEQEETVFDFQQSLLNAVMTIPENLMAVADNLLDPLGLNIGDVGNMQSAAEEQEISHGTFGEMQARFDGQAGAFAYLLFILLYAPCVAATAAIQRETGTKWTIFIVSWTTGIAYMTATIFYQLATYTQHRETSLFWIIGLLTLFGSVIFSFWLAGRAELKRGVA
ncbi:ferrous iron transport protein B [Bathymodiolus platifrons methanotrophic gill symbiont]|uniref:Fe(2+) transporter permease subunit FeoB n=1 Tax=Bathymodiolus platifrons methanotrophic gill symbiont TaxID=113268 RepID=UPI000B40A099|nr:Fe(2+) transporter permease subunit FeoB [Bathymodiolus platifrons methanotrophic gill symbiont]TXK94266.1 ferrous iron transport protein B [Methylococcaceae bacterium CS5]TXK98104.1 ferrous iron transport protein B [Methylococcaceae bacterium CS4]TXL04475.1 ferrous iron transport protein B [Methylococcaceae bacterium CS1]TXL07978.1 ferrous iron transport protein B [Methylococcaceae bacterium CS3]TXL11788.1 ferrous iron transport protein B [Methylococcaceae bacterium CS2]TXL14993.1 ferrous